MCKEEVRDAAADMEACVLFDGCCRRLEIRPKLRISENFKDATKSMDRKEEGKEEEKGRKEGRKGGKGERKVLGGVRDGHICLTLSDDG